MEMKMLEHILDDAASWPEPLKGIVPIHYGELFLDPDWYDTLKLIETKLPRNRSRDVLRLDLGRQGVIRRTQLPLQLVGPSLDQRPQLILQNPTKE